MRLSWALMLAATLYASSTFADQQQTVRKQAPQLPAPRQVVVRPVQQYRPGVIQRGPVAPGGERPIQSRATFGNSAFGGVPGAGGGRPVAAPAISNAMPASPRAQLFDLVRPTNPRAALIPAVAPARAAMAPKALATPAALRFDRAHRIGSAGLSHHHTAFVFRHDGHRFRRAYYQHGDVWFWSDVPLPEDDPAFLVDDAAVPDCDPSADICGPVVQPACDPSAGVCETPGQPACDPSTERCE